MFTVLEELIQNIFTEDNLYRAARIFIYIAGGILIVKTVSMLVAVIFRKRLNPQLRMLFSKIINYSGLFFISIAVLLELNIDLSIILGTAGVAGIALGFASQTSLSNFISGLFLITEKPFQIGDIIQVNENIGTVSSIDALSVKIRTFDNKYVRIPNESLIKSELINITKYPIRRLDIKLTLSYSDKLDYAKELLLSCAQDNNYCLVNPEPIFIYKQLTERGIELMFGVWCAKEDYIETRNTILRDIIEKFKRNGITMPYPHIHVHNSKNGNPIPH